MSSSANRNNNSNNSLTVLDRKITVILNNPDETGSRKDNISSYIERIHRLHGTSLILESSKELSVRPSTYATACTIFHRFYQQVSLREYDVWSVAMTSTLLATKIEEEPKALSHIIYEYSKMYARRLLLLDLVPDDDPNNDSSTTTPAASTVLDSPHVAHLIDIFETSPKNDELNQRLSSQKRRKILRSNRLSTQQQQMSKYGPVYKEWCDQLSKMESIVLRQLGFTLYWIPDSHPHKYILYFCQVLELNINTSFTRRAWNYCNDSCRLDLCVRYPAEIIASSAILLAARDLNIALPTKPYCWWKVFLGSESEKGQSLANVANAILGLGNGNREIGENDHDNHHHHYDEDLLVTSYGFVPSMITRTRDNETSFNDPHSFLWEYQKDVFMKGLDQSSNSSDEK